jgi:CheY-like chemotaxis protein/HPt (histidine-containing phosphotransfer) domain-containing protein
LILDRQLLDAEPNASIMQLETAGTELPPVIVVTEHSGSLAKPRPFMRPTDVELVRPITSSALFNAINSAVWSHREGRERILESTIFDEQRAQWLVGVKVLAVDDSDINLEVARRILERQGAIVTTCSDGERAMDYIRLHHQQLDIVLMDVQMPILDGNEATRRIRRELNLQALPIVALTAGALVGERQRSLEAGMNDFVSKPFDPQSLIRKVRRLVEQARGAPIPIAVIDQKPVGQVADWTLMPSLDPGVLQQMFGDELSLFTSLLSRVLQEHADFATPIVVSRDDHTACAALRRRAHKLKGSAGMIGATRLMQLAGAVEAALQDGRAVDLIERLLAQLASAFITLREEAQHMFDTQLARVQNSSASEQSDRNIVGADVAELCELLEQQNLAAVDTFSSLAQAWRELLGTAPFDRVRDAIDNLEFSLASELLRAALPTGQWFCVSDGVRAASGAH